jgi:beta-galactosidase
MKKRLHFLVILLLATVIVNTAFSQSEGPSREKSLLDFGWRFHFGNAANPKEDFNYGIDEVFAKTGDGVDAAKIDFNDSTWRKVNLPHDWAVELPFFYEDNWNINDHGYKPIGRQFPTTSIGWYRRSFIIPPSDSTKRILVKFDGVFRDCTVWLNDVFIGRNLSGYEEFSFDLTDYIRFGDKNVLTVRVDATQAEGWFYEGAGIYRHTWLIKYSPLHIPLYGTFVSSKVLKNSADVNIQTTIFNQAYNDNICKLYSIVLDKNGNKVGNSVTSDIKLKSYEKETKEQKIKIENPNLWSLDDPYLYRLISYLKNGKEIIDSTETTFGIRTISFDKNKGFLLNGKRVEIQGTCNHQDHAGVGSALPDRLQYFRIEKLKEMGVNAYRTSHNPPTNELLEACDKLGMLVMDETRMFGSTPDALKEFKRLILRDRNHPSVIIWSIGNEEWNIQNTEQGRRVAESMKHLQRELDPTRQCTYAANNGNRYKGVNSVVDIRGVNYLVLGDIDKYHKEHPDQPIWGSEEASTLCTRGIYEVDTVNGYVPDYDITKPGWGTLAEQWWKYYAARTWLAGAFVWTGFDYRGEPTPYKWPDINSHFGIMDMCGFPKNNYYYYQSWWTNKDILHIFPHWNWQGKEGQPIDVWCFSNCDSVELFLNGKSVGRKTMERNSHIEWKVNYQPGILNAEGWKNGRKLLTKVETTGKAVTIELNPDRSTINADGQDVSIISVSVLDSEGREVPTAENLIHFEIEGNGKIIGVGNGNPSSHEPDKYLDGNYERKLFSGKCEVIVQSTLTPGEIKLKATSDDLTEANLIIKSARVVMKPFAKY